MCLVAPQHGDRIVTVDCCDVTAPYVQNSYIKGERFLKVAGSHVRWKSGNILKMVLDRDVVTTGH